MSQTLPSRRRVLGSMAGSLAAAVPAVWSPVAAQGSRPRLHALLIGINTYTGRIIRPGSGTRHPVQIPSLKGCVNDVEVIERAVRPIAAGQPIVLREGQATRAAVQAAWRQTLGRAAAGDCVLLTFSGHGARLPKRGQGGRQSDFLRILMLAGYDSERAADMITNDEVRAMTAEASRKGVRVAFVADCCHAGRLTRSVAEEVASYRTTQDIDVAGGLDAELASIEAQAPPRPDPPNTLFFAACLDEERVREIRYNGRFHGAMSVAFALALDGLATNTADGAVTVAQLDAFVMAQVKNLSDSEQHPEVRGPAPAGPNDLRREDVLFYTRTADKPSPPAAADAVRLAIRNLPEAEQRRLAGELTGATLVEPGPEADLIWDAGTREGIGNGLKIAEEVPAQKQALQAMVDRMRALNALKRLATRNNLSLRLLTGNDRLEDPPRPEADQVHKYGTQLSCVVVGLRYRHLVVINITGSGQVQMLYPLRRQGDPDSVATGKPFRLPPFKVEPPFGSDHVVAIAGERPLDELIGIMSRLNGTQRPLDAIAAIEKVMAGGRAQVGFQGIFSSR